MTKHLRLFAILATICFFIFGTALLSDRGLTANNSGAPSMRTGSPGDTKSCTTCHTGTAQNGAGIISSNVPPTGYVPGNTYIIDAHVSDPNLSRFGFEISPQNVSGAKLGVITITDVARTKLVGSGKYITHTASGTSGTGSNSWSFNWTAPPSGTGDVTFYGAFNFSNHNNATSGDIIKLDQLTLHEDLSTFIETADGNLLPEVYPNPATDVATVSIPANVTALVVFDMQGNEVRSFEVSNKPGLYKIDVTTFRSGTYYVSFTTDKGMFSTKLIKL